MMPDSVELPTTPQQAALISRLAADLRPVSRLVPPWRRAAMWVLASIWIAMVLSFFTNWSTLWTRLMSAPDMWISQLGAMLTAVLAGVAALQTAIPGRSPAWALLPLPPLALWVGASTAGCLRLSGIKGALPESPTHPMVCMQFLLLISVPLSALLTWLLIRAYPLRPGLTAALAGLASAGAAVSLLALIHPFDATTDDLLMHGAAVIAVVLATRLVAGPVLRRLRDSPTFRVQRSAGSS